VTKSTAKKRAPRNRTISLSDAERQRYQARLSHLTSPVTLAEIVDKTIHQDLFEILDWLPEKSIDLLFADPPYNLGKSFNGRSFGSPAQIVIWYNKGE